MRGSAKVPLLPLPAWIWRLRKKIVETVLASEGDRIAGRSAYMIEPTVERELQKAPRTDCTQVQSASKRSLGCPKSMDEMLDKVVGE